MAIHTIDDKVNYAPSLVKQAKTNRAIVYKKWPVRSKKPSTGHTGIYEGRDRYGNTVYRARVGSYAIGTLKIIYKGNSLEDAIKIRNEYTSKNKVVQRPGKFQINKVGISVVHGKNSIRYIARGGWKKSKSNILYSGNSLSMAIKARDEWEKREGRITTPFMKQAPLPDSVCPHSSGHWGIRKKSKNGVWSAVVIHENKRKTICSSYDLDLVVAARNEYRNTGDFDLIKKKYSHLGDSRYRKPKCQIKSLPNGSFYVIAIFNGSPVCVWSGKRMDNAEFIRDLIKSGEDPYKIRNRYAPYKIHPLSNPNGCRLAKPNNRSNQYRILIKSNDKLIKIFSSCDYNLAKEFRDEYVKKHAHLLKERTLKKIPKREFRKWNLSFRNSSSN